jgi:hypothetical protein
MREEQEQGQLSSEESGTEGEGGQEQAAAPRSDSASGPGSAGWGSPPGTAGWSRRPVLIPRRALVNDYGGSVSAFTAHLPYLQAARGSGPKVPCLLCNCALATRAFLPCSHSAVCDSCMKASGIGPMRMKGSGSGEGSGSRAEALMAAEQEALYPSGAATTGGSDYLSWDMCPLCNSTILAVVPCGTVQDAKVRQRVEDIMVSVAGPAQAAKSAEELVAAGHGPLGPGFGGAEGPVSHRFKVHFGECSALR